MGERDEGVIHVIRKKEGGGGEGGRQGQGKGT